MRPFAYARAESASEAIRAAALHTGAREPEGAPQYLAGGTTLVDLMKLDVMRPARVIDINALEETRAGRIEKTAGGLRIGALVRMSDAA